MTRFALFSWRGATRRKDFRPRLEFLEQRWLPATSVVPPPSPGDSAAVVAPADNDAFQQAPQQQQQQLAPGQNTFVALPGGTPLVITTGDTNLLRTLRLAEVPGMQNGDAAISTEPGDGAVVSPAVLASGQRIEPPPVVLNPILAFGGGRKIPELTFPPSGGSGADELRTSFVPLEDLLRRAIPEAKKPEKDMGVEQEDPTEERAEPAARRDGQADDPAESEAATSPPG